MCFRANLQEEREIGPLHLRLVCRHLSSEDTKQGDSNDRETAKVFLFYQAVLNWPTLHQGHFA